MKFTKISGAAILTSRAASAHGATICKTCGDAFLDGVEGSPDDEDCDLCWYAKYRATRAREWFDGELAK